MRYIIALSLLFFSSLAQATNYFVDGSVADDNGAGTSWAVAKKYIQSGIALMASGDDLYVADGTYTTDADRIISMPSGTAENYTVIKATNNFGVILSTLTAGTAPSNEEAVVNVYQKHYVEIEGFLVKDCQGDGIYELSCFCIYESSHIKIKNCGVKNGVDAENEYGGAFEISASSYCLVQDSFACGMMRYGAAMYDGDTNHHNIFRRVVVRWDFCTIAQPRASIVCYGGDSGTTVCDNNIFQNCIVIDGNDGTTNFTGGFSTPHETSYVTRYGCISFNNKGYGIHSSEDSLSHDNMNIHCLIWDSDAGMYWKNLASGTNGATNCTIENVDLEGPDDGNEGDTYDLVATDCVFIGTVNLVGMSAVSNSTAAAGDFSSNYTVSPTGNGADGATIVYKMGTDDTLWGEEGYATLTENALWPFPNQDEIRTLFREANNPVGDLVPVTNDVDRGFCATDMTLTLYLTGSDDGEPPASMTGDQINGVSKCSGVTFQ